LANRKVGDVFRYDLLALLRFSFVRKGAGRKDVGGVLYGDRAVL
jgi:hypothetical protein